MTDLATRLGGVQQRITQAAITAQRNPAEITLLAVSKTHPAEAIAECYALDQRHFAENYLQESLQKISVLNQADIIWHFIGPLQSNKSRAVAEHFHWLHTLDRAKLAERLNDQRPAHLPPLNVCIQVNISDETSKSGISLAEVPALAAHIQQFPHLCLRGLMCIPAPQETDLLRADFAKMQAAFLSLRQTYNTVDTLSMGMSDDLEIAIAAGSTMVRIGTAIFGQREYHKEI